MSYSKKIANVAKGCVACGSCVKPCPLGAISIYKGLSAVVEPSSCVGCGKCATKCPAGIIEINLREVF